MLFLMQLQNLFARKIIKMHIRLCNMSSYYQMLIHFVYRSKACFTYSQIQYCCITLQFRALFVDNYYFYLAFVKNCCQTRKKHTCSFSLKTDYTLCNY